MFVPYRLLPLECPGVFTRPVSYIVRQLLLVTILAISSVVADVAGLTDALLEHISKTYGPAAKERVLDWQTIMITTENKKLSDIEKLRLVNRFFNRLQFVDDIEHWRKRDYWATPVEMLSTNGGDCEDFSIGKYFTLKELGIADEKLRITYVKAIRLNQAHMVLAYYSQPGAEPLILDNLEEEILPASMRGDLVPVYSFNGDGLWLAKERGEGKKIGTSSRISLWRDVNSRMKKERELH